MIGLRLRTSGLVLCVCALALLAPSAFAEESELTHLFGNHECPIGGDPVDPTTFAIYEDADNNVYGRIYVCCGGCLKKAESSAADLYKKYYLTDEEGEKTDPVNLENKECPISGGDVSEAGMIEYNGMIVGHCCAKCPAKFLENPDEHLAKLATDDLKEKYEMKE